MTPISKLRVLILSFFLFSWSHPFQRDSSTRYEELKQGFMTPPAEARPKVYWWWLNGNVDTIKLIEELTAMKEIGFAGVDIFDIGARVPNNPGKMIPAGPPFMGPESVAALTMVIKKATEYKMEVSLNLASSWNAGGSWIRPQHAGKSLYHSKVVASGPGQQKITIPFPKISPLDEKGRPRVIEYDASHKPVYYKEVAVLAMPAEGARGYKDTSKIINVSAFFNSEQNELNWNLPEGKWEIQRFICSNSGEQLKYYSDNSAGPIIDHFDSSATRAHFMYFINALQPRLGDFRKTALKNLYLASFEATGSVWTESLPVEFRKINGYDIYKLMPALVSNQVFDSTINKKFKHDFDLVISELMVRNHYGKGKEIANSYGLKLISESGGPGPPLHNVPVEGIKALGALDIPRGEFWNRHAIYDQDSIDLLMLVKEISAAAHMYHRKIAEEESFTSYQHWTEGPVDLKPIGDRAFCEGMNRQVIHGFSHNPSVYGFPGIVYHAGSHFNNKNLWWSKAKPFLDYLSRISYVMQETRFVSDVLYYYGDQVPNFVTPKNTRFTVGPGFDYDIINSDVLLRELAVENGRLVLPGGASFRVLSLGNMENANAAVVEKLKKLAGEGAIITGQKPVSTMGLLHQPLADQNLRNTVQESWTSTGTQFNADLLGRGKILENIPALQVLKAMRIAPDFDYPGNGDGTLDYIHQRQDDLHIYFIRNTTDQWISKLCSFRQTGSVPELWDPVTAKVLPVNIYDDNKKQTRLPISLAPYQSYLVVFKRQTPASHYKTIRASADKLPLLNYTASGLEVLESGNFELVSESGSRPIKSVCDSVFLDGPWTLSFVKGWGTAQTASFEKLISLTESSDSGIKYYSGPVTYSKTFSYKGVGGTGEEQVYLDLGDLSKIAELWLNGKSLGISWTKPYVFNITGLIKKGDNTIKVEVVNTWANRLTGDFIRGEKYTSTNLGINSQGVNWKQDSLLRSGLFGPVTIQRRTAIH